MIEDLKKFYMVVEEDKRLYEEIRHSMNDYNFTNGMSREFIREKLIPIAEGLGFKITCEEVLDYESQRTCDISKITDDELLKVAGGKMDRRALGMGLLSIMLYGSSASAISNNKRHVEVYRGLSSGSTIKSNKLDNIMNLSVGESAYNKSELVKFISEAGISEAQMRAFEITNALTLKEKQNVGILEEISSLRYSKYGKIKTRVERILDEGVSNGDLPIKDFFINEIQKIKNSILKNVNEKNEDVKKANFLIPKRGIDAIDMHKFIDDESIVQVASQFNALESVCSEPSAVCSWIYDRTQGPRAALQSVAGAKHRESAHLQGKLPDAIQELLDTCMVEDAKGKQVSITKKYPFLYKNGYLNLSTVSNEKNVPKEGIIKKIVSIFKRDDGNKKIENKKSDLEILREHIHNNIGRMKFLSQWVICEGTGKKQLQVFNAGPSFQDSSINWDNNDERTLIFKDICKEIVVSQYRAIAQVASIRSEHTLKPVSVHLTMVGQGAFKNPPEVMVEAIKAVVEELSGTNVKVYLHGLTEATRTKWESILKDIDEPYEFVEI